MSKAISEPVLKSLVRINLVLMLPKAVICSLVVTSFYLSVLQFQKLVFFCSLFKSALIDRRTSLVSQFSRFVEKISRLCTRYEILLYKMTETCLLFL